MGQFGLMARLRNMQSCNLLTDEAAILREQAPTSSMLLPVSSTEFYSAHIRSPSDIGYRPFSCTNFCQISSQLI